MELKLHRGDPINRFNPATFVFLSEARTDIFPTSYWFFYVHYLEVKYDWSFGGIVEHHCNFLLIMNFSYFPFYNANIRTAHKLFGLWSFVYEHTCWGLFQKRVVRTKFDIYLLIILKFWYFVFMISYFYLVHGKWIHM